MSAVFAFGRPYPRLNPFCQNVPVTLVGDVSMRDHETRLSEDRQSGDGIRFVLGILTIALIFAAFTAGRYIGLL